MQNLGNDPGKVKKEDKVGAGPQKTEKWLCPYLSNMQSNQTQMDAPLLLCQRHKQDKNAAP